MNALVLFCNIKSIICCFERHYVIQSFQYMFVMFLSTLLWKIMIDLTCWALEFISSTTLLKDIGIFTVAVLI